MTALINRVEQLKKEKDGLDVIHDIHAYAQSGGFIDQDTVDRMKWYGLYTQKPGTVKDEIQYFMLRIKLVGGRVTAEQLRTIGRLSEMYARNTADLTTRQDIQFHWVLCRDLPAIFEGLADVGISTQFAAGDTPRNVVTCPVCDVDRDAALDTTPYVQAINDFFKDNRAFSNLPRKFKIGVNACSHDCIHPEIQDVCFNAFEHEGETLFEITIGGGLGKGKRIASSLGLAVPGDEIVAAASALAAIFRDFGNRESRSSARMRHLVESMGVEAVADLLKQRCLAELVPVAPQSRVPASLREHYGIHPSKTQDRVWIGTSVFGGVLDGETLEALAEAMEQRGIPHARVTAVQNLVFADLPAAEADPFVTELDRLGITARPPRVHAGMLTCTGARYCKFAITETKLYGKALAEALDHRFADLNAPLRVHVNGCPNNCAHAPTGDVGLVGCKVKTPKGSVPGYEIFVGGHLEGAQSVFACKTGLKLPADEIEGWIADWIERYRVQREPGERIGAFLRRRLEVKE